MSVVVADLVAKVRAEGIQETAAAVKAVGVEATQTARALEIMAQQFVKSGQGGTVQGWLDVFSRQGVQPTAAAMAEAAKQAERTTAAVVASIEPTKAAASATADIGKGWSASESSIVRFGTALVGINLGISLVAGAARTLHEAISSVVDAHFEWERSLVRVRALYGDLGPQVLQTAQVQTLLPGSLSTQQENIQSQLNARYLASRYGLAQTDITRLTTAGVRAAGALGLFEQSDRASLQASLLQFAESGGSGLRDIGVEGDPLSIARRLGGVSGAQLQALTPAQLRQAQLLIASEGANRLAATGTSENSLLAQRTRIEQQLNIARGNLATGGGPSLVEPLGPELTGRFPGTPYENFPSTLAQSAADNVKNLSAELQRLTNELGKAGDAAEKDADALRKLGIEEGTAAFRLLGFGGNLEDRYSIARGDIGAQVQGAVAARARSAIPLIGQTQGERTAVSTNLAYQQVYQNYVAQQAQETQDNAIQEFFQNQIRFGPAANRAAAGRALAQAPQLAQINSRMAEAQQAGGLVDIASAETQAKLEQITLTQRERGVQLLRDTVDLRKLDVQQQQAGLEATQAVIRATQAALPASYALSGAQYQGNLAGALARQRLGRSLRGQDVSGLPSINDLITMSVNAQFAEAELGPAALQGARSVEVAQQTATARGLAQQLTAGQLQSAQLTTDLANLGDLPTQTALMLEDIQNSRDQLTVQKELRDLTKDLVNIMRGRPAANTSDQGIQDLATRLGVAIFGDGSDIALPAPSDQPGARRGPY